MGTYFPEKYSSITYLLIVAIFLFNWVGFFVSAFQGTKKQYDFWEVLDRKEKKQIKKRTKWIIRTIYGLSVVIFVGVFLLYGRTDDPTQFDVIREWLEQSEYRDAMGTGTRFWIDFESDMCYLKLKEENNWLRIGVKENFWQRWEVDEESIAIVNDVNGEPEDLVDK
jgi:hypothetical protein